jgi:hydrogenase-4 component B
MPLSITMSCVAVLLLATCFAIAISRMRAASSLVYGLSLIASLTAFFVALVHLIRGAPMSLMVTLPLGLPWLGAHFQMDALSAFFLLVVNLVYIRIASVARIAGHSRSAYAKRS